MRESKSRVTAGIVEFEHTALNQNDEVVAVCLRQALMLKKAQSAELATSFLFVPANRPDRFDKAANSGADAIILDLEDSVPAQEKQLARDAVLQWMRTPRIGISVWIRVNPLQSQGLLADLRTAVAAKPHGIVLPKCEGADDVHALSSLLSVEEVKLGIDAGTTSVIAIVTETARAMQRINTFDHPIARLYGMLWGAEDLAAS
eukprot:gene41802-51790_t